MFWFNLFLVWVILACLVVSFWALPSFLLPPPTRSNIMCYVYLDGVRVASFSNRAAAESFIRYMDPLYVRDYMIV